MTYVQRFALAAFAAAAVVCSHVPVQAQEGGEDESGTRLIRDPAVEEAYSRGRQLLTEEKPKEALAEFNKALQGTPEFQGDSSFAEAWIGKGDALSAIEDYASAVSAFNQATQFGPNMPAAYNGRGEALLKTNQIDGAAADFARALELDPSNPKILSNMGHVLINYARDPQGAIRRLDDAIAQNDKDARAYRDRGWAHALLQNFKAAEEDLKKAAAIDPDDHENFSSMANIALFQNNLPIAIDALTQAIAAYKPKTPQEPKIFLGGYLGRANAWLRMGEQEKDQAAAQTAFQNAIADADAVIKDNPDRFPEAGRAEFQKGRALRMLQRYSEAVDTFTDAIEGIPEGQEAEYLAEAYMYRGICWYYIGSHDLARGDFEQASSVGGGFGDARIFLWIGFTHHQEGDYREAIEAYSEAIGKSPKFALAHTNRGRAYMDLDEYGQAIRDSLGADRRRTLLQRRFCVCPIGRLDEG
jgi:tetratricopeptide (TPR) repeat protein